MPVVFHRQRTRVPKAGPRNRPTQHTMKTSRQSSTRRENKKDRHSHSTRHPRTGHDAPVKKYETDPYVRWGKSSLPLFVPYPYLFQYARPFGLEPEQVGFVDRSFFSLSLSLHSLSLSIMNPARFQLGSLLSAVQDNLQRLSSHQPRAGEFDRREHGRRSNQTTGPKQPTPRQPAVLENLHALPKKERTLKEQSKRNRRARSPRKKSERYRERLFFI